MAESTTHHRTTEADTIGDSSGSTPTKGAISFGAGAAGVVAAVLPGLGLLALALAAVAIGAGVPVMRRGPGTPCFGYARIGLVLGMIAVLLGFLSLAVQFL